MKGLRILALLGLALIAGCSAYSQPGPYRDVKTGPNLYCGMDPPNQPGCP